MAIYYTPRDLASDCGVSDKTARAALLHVVARRLGVARDAGQHWRFDLDDVAEVQIVDAARQRLRKSAQHGLSLRSRSKLA